MIIVTFGQFRASTGCSEQLSRAYLPFFNMAMSHYAINANSLRAAAFLSQCGHESMDLTRLSENLNYGKEGLLKTWPSRFNEYSAATYARQPEAIANVVYAGRFGNGDEASGDGWRYRGRGFIQITFRDNYERAGKALGYDLINDPDQASKPEIAAQIAAWFWNDRDLNGLADRRRFDAITERINGGFNGLADRRARLVRALGSFK